MRDELTGLGVHGRMFEKEMELKRLEFLTTHALENIRANDEALYHRVMMQLKDDIRPLLEIFNEFVEREDTPLNVPPVSPDELQTPKDIAEILVPVPNKERIGRLMTWLADKPSASELHSVLARIDKFAK